MRFHIGCSFRPKNLLKYLFPFLLGVLAILGIDKVSARTININYDTFYQVEIGNYEEEFSTTIPGLEYSISTLNEFLNSLSNDNNAFGHFSYVDGLNINDNQYISFNYVYYTISSCPYTEQYFDFYGQTRSNLSYSNIEFAFNSTNNPGCKTRYTTFFLNSSDATYNANAFRNLVDSLGHVNTLTYSNSNAFYFNSRVDDTMFNNANSYTIIPNSFLYDTSETLVLTYNSSGRATSSSPYDYYFKTLNLNGIDINNVLLPTYLQLLQLQGQLNTSYYRLPYNYFSMNKSDISTFNGKFKYTPVINAAEYVDLVTGGDLNFYGRFNHNNDYYTYEQINCTLSRTSSINSNNNQVLVNYGNLTCTSDLTNYDKIYIYESFKYDYDTLGHYDLSVLNISLTSNVDSFTSNEYRGNLYEPLTLQNGFKILISSNSQNKVNYITDNDYLSFNKLSNEDITHIDNTISGVEIGYNHIKSGGRLPRFYTFNVGTYDQSMYYLYDNYTLHSSTQTDLKLFYENPSSVMLSFPIVINGEDTFTYYNSEGNVTNGTTIQTNYGDIGGNYTQQEILDTSLFDPINDFLDSIEDDLISMHELNQTIFDNIPTFIKAFIVVIYSLFLLSILFKEVKR